MRWKVAVAIGIVIMTVVVSRPRERGTARLRAVKREWTERYGAKTVAKIEAGAKAHHWKMADDALVYRAPTRTGMREVQDINEPGPDGGSLMIWSADDGNINTLEGTVEILYPSGRMGIMNMQLYTPDGIGTNAQLMWADVYHTEIGDRSATSEWHVRYTREGPSLPRLLLARQSSTDICRPSPGELDFKQTDCMIVGLGETIARAWRGAEEGFVASVPACATSPDIKAKAICLAAGTSGGFMVRLWSEVRWPTDPPRDCRRTTQRKQWCEENGYNPDYNNCDYHNAWQDPWCR